MKFRLRGWLRVFWWNFRLGRKPKTTLDAQGIPTHACPACGFNMFHVVCSFEDYFIGMYETKGTCVNCRTTVTVPTPLDDPDYDPYDDEEEW